MKKKILICIPAYDSKIFALGMVSLFDNMKELEKLGHEVTFTIEMSNVYLDLTRNKLVDTFLSGEWTDMVFFDSDLAFDSDAIVKLMKHDVPVIGGAYPYRGANDQGYPIDIKLDENNFPVVDKEKQIIECLHIPTGLMRIQRKTFDLLNKAYPNNRDKDGKTFHFRTGLLFSDRGDFQYYGEDVYFCKICNEAGIKVYCDPTINFIHFGTLPKQGKFADWLKAGGDPSKAKVSR